MSTVNTDVFKKRLVIYVRS